MKRLFRMMALLMLMSLCIGMLGACAKSVVEESAAGADYIEGEEQQGGIISGGSSQKPSSDSDSDQQQPDDQDDGKGNQNADQQKGDKTPDKTDDKEEQKPDQNIGDKDEELPDEDEELLDEEDDTVDYKKEDILVVMSQNVRYKSDVNDLTRPVAGTSLEERHFRVLQQVDESNPDLMGFQEVTPQWIDFLKLDHGDKYDYYYTFRGSGTTTGASTYDECSAVFWKKDRFQKIDEGHFWLSETPDVVSKSKEASHHRICNWVRLKNKATGKVFTFASLHADGSTYDHILTADLVNNRLKPKQYPAILVGDFNMTPDSDGYTHLTTAGLFNDLRWEVSPGDMDGRTTAEGYHLKTGWDKDGFHRSGPIIDYIFVSVQEKTRIFPISYDVLQYKYGSAYGFADAYVSDHFGLLGKVAIPS